ARCERARRTGNNGNALLLREGAGCDFVAEQREGGGRRTDEAQTLGPAALGEAGILRQEAVAGMDTVGTALLGGGDDGVDVEIGTQRITGVLADLASLVRQFRVQR